MREHLAPARVWIHHGEVCVSPWPGPPGHWHQKAATLTQDSSLRPWSPGPCAQVWAVVPLVLGLELTLRCLLKHSVSGVQVGGSEEALASGHVRALPCYLCWSAPDPSRWHAWPRVLLLARGALQVEGAQAGPHLDGQEDQPLACPGMRAFPWRGPSGPGAEDCLLRVWLGADGGWGGCLVEGVIAGATPAGWERSPGLDQHPPPARVLFPVS